MQSLLVLGRQPELGIAELESLYGSTAMRNLDNRAALLDVDPCLLAYDRLGGSVKFCKVLAILDMTIWRDIEDYLRQVAPKFAVQMPEGKMRLDLSAVNLDISPSQLIASGLTLKKAIRKTGRSVRIIPNKSPELNSAQVIHNQLTSPTGWELVFVRDGSQTVIAQTVKVQAIGAYTRRDRLRPNRDSRVGMLPPKLAQIIVNLAAGKLNEESLQSICDIPAGDPIPFSLLNKTVLDPFCGTGVILQEALLMGYDGYGTDLETRMIEYTTANLKWLTSLYKQTLPHYELSVGDATSYTWSQSPDFIASETYLGRPFTTQPSPKIAAQTVAECNIILAKFLKNIGTQIASGTRLCLAVPAWQILPNQFTRLPLIDQIKDLGYNQVSFEHIGKDSLIYYRPDQIVARELLVLTKR